ncbi:MAG: hypothetical protein KDD70_12980 [Bdellovibrionales bacterium]|nr:hypothetical protein [Bdellovibrionales bacterium]
MTAKKSRYLTKTVTFNNEELTLYSLDGATWSSRKQELSDIQTRHEDDRVTFEEIRSGVVNKKNGKERDAEDSGPAPQKAAKEQKLRKEVARTEPLPKPKSRTSQKKASQQQKSAPRSRAKKSEAA